MKRYIFRTVPLSITRSIRVEMQFHPGPAQAAFEQDQDGTADPSWSCSKAVCKPVWHILLLSVQWMNSWLWTKELSETCSVSCQNKFVKLVHLFGFVIKEICYDARSHVRKKTTIIILTFSLQSTNKPPKLRSFIRAYVKVYGFLVVVKW